MVIFYKKWKKCNEIQLTKDKMDLNNRKMTNHLPSHGQQINSGIYKSSSPKTTSDKNKQRIAAKQPTEFWGSLREISGTISKN